MSLANGAGRTLALLRDAPPEAGIALVLRHAERGLIPAGSYGNDVLLTPQGLGAARRLGARLSCYVPATVRTSPLPRCVQTADAISSGAGWDAAPVGDRLLGAPGAFVIEPERFGRLFLEIGARRAVERLLTDAEPPPGMRAAAEGTQRLLGLLTPAPETRGRLSLFVTHDIVLAALVGRLYRRRVGEFAWPDYLEGLAIWRDSDQLRFSWPGLDEGSRPIGGQADGLPG